MTTLADVYVRGTANNYEAYVKDARGDVVTITLPRLGNLSWLPDRELNGHSSMGVYQAYIRNTLIDEYGWENPSLQWGDMGTWIT